MAGTKLATASPATTTKPANSQASFIHKTLATVFLALFIDILAFTIILPLFPRLLEHYDKVDGNDETSLYYSMRSAVQSFRSSLGIESSGLDIVLFGGALGSLFSFLQFISSPIIGRLSDRFGRRRVLLLSMIGNGISMLLWIFSRSFTTFVWSRVIGGLTEGNVQMSIAMISDLTTPETRSKGLALVGIAFSLGFTIGPPLGAYFTSFDLLHHFPILQGLPINRYSSPALFAFILIVLETGYLCWALPETKGFQRAETKESKPTRKAQKSENGIENKEPLRHTAHRLNSIHFLFLFFFSGMEFTLTFLTHDRFSFTHSSQGKFLGFIGIMSALVQGLYTRRFARIVGEKVIAVQGMIACSFGLWVLGCYAYPNSAGWLWVGAAGLAVTSGTVVTTLTALASYESGRGDASVLDENEGDNRGHVLGVFRSVGQLGRSLGPMVACSIYWVMGGKVAYQIAAMCVGGVAVALVMGVKGNGKAQEKREKKKTQ
ncbi:major facilitator superfamily domain-containing protein [Gaertneriomyces semiglobifer]|nr:major facilitator superfamily domain-containing protein [Gaertneriomyces semiglobifer]